MIAANEDFDIIIIGGGPAGLSCAIWCGDLGVNAILSKKMPNLVGIFTIYSIP